MTDPTPDGPDLNAVLRQHHAWDQPELRAARKVALDGTLRDSFERHVDPGRELSAADRAVRAHHARLAHYALFALRSSRARKRCQITDLCFHDDHGEGLTTDSRTASPSGTRCGTRIVGKNGGSTCKDRAGSQSSVREVREAG